MPENENKINLVSLEKEQKERPSEAQPAKEKVVFRHTFPVLHEDEKYVPPKVRRSGW